jgi:hypothetical protein
LAIPKSMPSLSKGCAAIGIAPRIIRARQAAGFAVEGNYFVWIWSNNRQNLSPVGVILSS